MTEGPRKTFMSIVEEGLRRKRGRPRLPSWDDILPWSKIMHPEDLARAEADMWLHRLQTRNKGEDHRNGTSISFFWKSQILPIVTAYRAGLL